MKTCASMSLMRTLILKQPQKMSNHLSGEEGKDLCDMRKGLSRRGQAGLSEVDQLGREDGRIRGLAPDEKHLRQCAEECSYHAGFYCEGKDKHNVMSYCRNFPRQGVKLGNIRFIFLKDKF